ncbi:ADP-ribosylglycohydrolase family protein [Aureivirga marina]|uniref:ADP-ribosylglycohydrolase family protein n=1 Tax=Aureivirga marina TaxID=1182451 RepID=UPI0018C96EA8|nr:ADP-ribosylglycohydrolase family protein [Aureivirga marina]
MKPITKYKGSIKLAAIGDALGWITEFENNKQSLKEKYNVEEIKTFYNWEKKVGGKFNGYVDEIKEGSYSDDTQLVLSVARSIKNGGDVDNEYFSKFELPNWLLYSRGAGRTVKNAAKMIQRKSAKWNDNFFKFKINTNNIDYRDCGANGAAMRILPIALANFGDFEKIKKEIFKNSIITHGHPRAIIGAILYGDAINTILLYREDSFSFNTFLIELGKDMHSKYSIKYLLEEEFFDWEMKWNSKYEINFRELYQKTLDETQEYLRIIYRYLISEPIDLEVLKSLGCFDKETKGSGISTVVAGIYFLCKYFDSPQKSLEKPVNFLGIDTDSIAAFTGGLLGALYGQNIIPDKWKKIQDLEYLDVISERLLKISEGNYNDFFNQDSNSDFNYLSNIQKDDLYINQKVYLDTLGEGIVTYIDRQDTLTKGKYNLIINVDFKIGQSGKFTKILNKDELKIDVNDIEQFNKYLDGLDSLLINKIKLFMEILKESDKKEFIEIIEGIRK